MTDANWGHFQASGYTYGSPRVWLDLYEDGWRVSKNTVARVMSEHAWHGRTPPRRRSLTRASDQNVAPDLVRRCFWSSRVDDRWVGDVTYVPTGEGWLYLATVIDLCSRRLLGYAMSSQHDSALTQAALAMAVATRRGEGRDPHGVVFHSDHGGEGEFNWSSQHLDCGGVQGWQRRTGAREPAVCPRVRVGSGVLTGR